MGIRWLALSVVLSPALALADIAPPPSALVHRPIPQAHLPRLDVGRDADPLPGDPQPLPDAPIDATLVSERVEVDAYPTFLLLRVTLLLRGGDEGVAELTVGFPEEELTVAPVRSLRSVLGTTGASPPRPKQYRHYAFRNLAVEDLEVRVDGEPVTAERAPLPSAVEREEPAVEGEASERGRTALLGLLGASPAPTWWTWSMAIPAERETRLELSYSQGLSGERDYDGSVRVPFQYPLFTAGVWPGRVERAELAVRLHGLGRDQLKYPSPELAADAPLRWTVDEVEATTEQVSFVIEMSGAWVETMRFGPPPYAVSALTPRLRLLDRLVRFARVHDPERIDPEADRAELELLIAEVRAAAHSEDPALRDFAGDVLAALQLRLGLAAELCPDLLTPPGGERPSATIPDAAFGWIPRSFSAAFDFELAALCADHAESIRRRNLTLAGGGALLLVAVGVVWRLRRRRARR